MPRSNRQPDIRGRNLKGPVTPDKDLHGIVGRARSRGPWSEEVSVDERWTEEEEQLGDVNLFSLTLLKEDDSGNINLCSAHSGGFTEAADCETEAGDAPRRDPETRGTSGRLPAHHRTPPDAGEVVLTVLAPGQPRSGEAEGSREGSGSSCGDLISHGGETEEEEEEEQEEEDEDCSGYLGR